MLYKIVIIIILVSTFFIVTDKISSNLENRVNTMYNVLEREN